MRNQPRQLRLKRIPAAIMALLLLGALLAVFSFADRSDKEGVRLDSGHRQMMGTYAQIVLRTSHEASHYFIAPKIKGRSGEPISPNVHSRRDHGGSRKIVPLSSFNHCLTESEWLV